MNWAQRLGLLALRLLATAGCAALLIALPDPTPEDTLRFKNAIVVLISIVVAGKQLFDTLFFDRYCGRQ